MKSLRSQLGILLGVSLGVLLAGASLHQAIPLLPSAQAASTQEGILNRLLAPGPLILGHKDLEGTDCLKCHDAGKGVPDTRCLDCHKEIRPFVQNKKGFHGLTQKTCIECHSDHKGRDFESAKVNESTFDHKATGYLLEGKHANIDCAKCHTATRGKKRTRPNEVSYFGTKASCLSCHKKDDPHRFKGDWAKKDCDSCHGLKSWKTQIRFDHEKDAHFKLIGKHAQVSCKDCHLPKNSKDSIYKWPELKTKECLSCHQDTHGNRLNPKFRGGKCEVCHNQDAWKIQNFPHEKITHYAIEGAHNKLKCTECHKQTRAALAEGKKSYKWIIAKSADEVSCKTCHKDIHQDNLGPKLRAGACEVCHNVQSWKIKNFDHKGITGYPLNGAHFKLECTQCHIQTKEALTQGTEAFRWVGLKQDCLSCHKDFHLFGGFKSVKHPQPNDCLQCHNESKWKEIHAFDHNKDTRYLIDGKHIGVTCAKCHITGTREPARVTPKKPVGIYHWNELETKTCELCHASPHRNTFSPELLKKRCTECHVTDGWKVAGTGKNFNHDKDSRFPLTGKHLELKCEECHKSGKKQVFRFPNADKKFCISCHENVHKEQFSSEFRERSCAECHSTKDFKTRYKFDHDQSRFQLRDKHAELKCSECHKPTGQFFKLKSPSPNSPMSKFLFPELSAKNCEACHKDPHRGEFGKSCQECHNEKDWKRTRDFHKNFTLSGVHYSLQCTECHKNDRNLSGMSQNCSLCHQKDDVHNGSLPKCGECHRQHFWETAAFRHSLTAFPLRGTHRTLDCEACHATGIYRGTPTRCVDCHLKDAPTTDPQAPAHTMPGFQNCDQCHNNFVFGK
jgi:hypothetical protein